MYLLMRRRMKRSNMIPGVWCPNQPQSEGGKRRQQFKMLFVTGVPILALVAISLYSLQESVEKRINLVEARQTVFFTVQVGWLIHLLQRERDMSVVYLTTISPNTKTLLADLWASTDAELVDLPDWPSNIDKRKRSEFENKKSFKAHLDKHRRNLQVDASLHDEILFYTKPMRVFMNWLTDSIKKAQHGTLWKTLIAYQKLIACKVDAGVERALGELFFSNRGFKSRDDFLWYNKEYHAFRSYFQLAQNYSSLVVPVVVTRTNTTSGQNLVETIEDFRKVIRYQNVSNSTFDLGKHWFNNMTEYLEVLLTIQRDLADLIFNQINDYIYETDTNVAISCVMMALALCMFPMLLKFVIRTTGDIQRYAIILADKTEELDREKHRTNTLLYQMLPKTVADHLKYQENANAEYYDQATVMFTGICDFNETTRDMDPAHVVSLISDHFKQVDQIIDLHDVYKVDTIGDKYMVASGLPGRSSQASAGVIADFALEVQKLVTVGVDVGPTMNVNLKLRMGIHSGPCMAGVVGLKLLKYSVFGETVGLASAMEQTCEPMRIHITKKTRGILCRTGGYRVKARGEVEISGTMMRTYWLKSKLAIGELQHSNYLLHPETSPEPLYDITEYPIVPRYEV